MKPILITEAKHVVEAHAASKGLQEGSAYMLEGEHDA